MASTNYNGMSLPTPLSLAQSNLTDPSPFCRHLMLLTESSAALRLLFECGLLKRDKAIVLVGSQFSRDANSELRMIRQINEIKRAMQAGHTVVLVNHEGIFPSLYDVLNMRYATKRNADTGKVTRMLRLAVGNRSQWCSVGEGFKIVVVVESKDAYEKLDLPLLNRFEKQMLRAEDVLESPESKMLLEALQTWSTALEKHTGVKDSLLGMYSQTLASLVHCERMRLRSVDNREISYPGDLFALQKRLARLISPLARIRAMNMARVEMSNSLATSKNVTGRLSTSIETQISDVAPAVTVGKDESETISELILPEGLFSPSDLQCDFFDVVSSAIAAKEHVLVLTFSSAHDLEMLLRHQVDRAEELGLVEPITLAGVTSEREFVHALRHSKSTKDASKDERNDLLGPVGEEGRTASGKFTRVVCCDPSATSQETIEHARYLSTHELNATKGQIVVFVIHMPPGGRKKRTFNLDFQIGWSVAFVDDLVRPDFMNLVQTTPSQWAFAPSADGMSNMMKVLRTKLSVSLAMARPPLDNGVVVISARTRVQQILRLLESSSFRALVLDDSMRGVLDKLNAEEHVEMVARGEARAGTVADSLSLALETIVLKAFAVVVRWYDMDFNLSLLSHGDDAVRSVWEMLSIVPPPESITTAQLEMTSTVWLRNSGRPGLPVVAQFPWSWRVHDTLEKALGEAIRSAAIRADSFEDQERFLRGVADTAFSPAFLDVSKPMVGRYLSDICGFRAHRQAEIPLEEQARLVESWLVRRHPSCLSSVVHVHIAFATESWAIFALLSIRAALAVLDFPPVSQLSFSSGFVETICAFLVDAKTLSNPLWTPTVELLAPNVLDALLKLESPAAQRAWMDVRFRHALVDSTACEPLATPPDLVDSIETTLTERPSQLTLRNRYLSMIAREVRLCHRDDVFLGSVIALMRSGIVDRQVRLVFMETVLKYVHRGPALDEVICTDAVLLGLAVDVTEDAWGVRNLIGLDPPQHVVDVCLKRQELRQYACTALIHHDNLDNSLVAHRAFLLNELIALHGDFGVVGKIKQSKELLTFFDAPRKYISQLDDQTDISNLAQSSKTAKLVIRAEDVEKSNCLSFIIGPALYREALALIDANVNFRTSSQFDDRDASAELMSAHAASKWKRTLELFETTRTRLNRTESQKREVLWMQAMDNFVSLSNGGDVLKEAPVLLVALLAAAAGKTIVERVSLLQTGVFAFIMDFVDGIVYMYEHAGRKGERPLLASLAKLCCSLHSETEWTTMFGEAECGENERLFVLMSAFIALLCEIPHLGQNQTSFLGDALRGRGGRLSSCYLPGMSSSDMESISMALGHVGWWSCPNGHKYAVGECTMPMEKGRCPECRAPVGGKDHEPVKGVNRIGFLDEAQPTHGYLMPQMEGTTRSLDQGSLSFYHLIFHSCALIGSVGPNTGELRVFFSPGERRMRLGDGEVRALCGKTIKRCWSIFWTKLGGGGARALNDSPATPIIFFAGLAALIVRARQHPFSGMFTKTYTELNVLRHPLARLDTEDVLMTLFRTAAYTVDFQVVRRIDEVRENLGAASARAEIAAIVKTEVQLESEVLMRDTTDAQASSVVSVSASTDVPKQPFDHQQIISVQWRFRAPVTIADLAAQVSASNNVSPFLRTFLRVEPRLQGVSRLADVLEWVAILNEALALRPKRLTREEAARLTNAQALEFIPNLTRREVAFEVLTRFCRAFNETFPLVPFLYECQRNPFLTEDGGKVDLSGSRGTSGSRSEMTPDTPVCFSLSAVVQGDADAPSLCLFQLIRALQQLNNALLVELEADLVARRERVRVARPRPHVVNNNVAINGDNNNPDPQRRGIDDEDSPATSILTPREVIDWRLINYDRERDLIPLLACASGKAYGLGKGNPRIIDTTALADALKRRLLVGKRPLRVVVPVFEYAGEAKRAGLFAGLHTRLPQIPLHRSIAAAVAAELDSDARVQPLLELVDSAVGFLAGAVGFDGETTLTDFAKNVLGMSEDSWMEIAPLPVQQNIKLCHIAAFFQMLEETKFGSPLDDVRDRYKLPLGPEQEGELRALASKLDLHTLLPILKDLLTLRLTQDTFPENAPLAEYLGYQTNLDLDSLPWFSQGFPQDLPMAHAYHVFMLWSDCV